MLYDIDYETNNIVLLQVLILMTDWYERPNDQKNARYWVSLAVSLARRLGLDHNPDILNAEPSKKGLCKRLWWSCCMRDWLTAVAMRRPPYISKGDHDVPLLTVDDFVFAALPEHTTCIPLDCTLARDIEQQRVLAVLCIERVKLCQWIPNVISASYEIYSNPESGFSGQNNPVAALMLRPKRPGSDLSEVESCDEQFRTWIDALPTAARRKPILVDGHRRAVDTHRSLLHMLYYAFLSTLHRPGFLSFNAFKAHGSHAAAGAYEYSRRQVQRAAKEITSVAEELNAYNMVQFLPTTGIWVMLPALLYHLSNMNGSVEEALATRHGFDQCLRIVDKLRSKYAAAEVTYAYLNEARLAMSRVPSHIGDGEENSLVMAEEPLVEYQQPRSLQPQSGEGPDIPATSFHGSHLSTRMGTAASSLQTDTAMADSVSAHEGSTALVGESQVADFSYGHRWTEDFGEGYASLVNLDAMIELFNSEGDAEIFDTD